MNVQNFLLLTTIMLIPFEGTIISFPIIFALGCLTFIISPDSSTMVILFIAGIILDILRVQTIGLTSMSMTLAFILIFLYSRIFEFKDWHIWLLIIFIFTLVFARVASYSTNLVVYVLIFMTSGILFSYFRRRQL